MSPRTVFLSKLLGLYCLFMAFAMVLHKEAIMEAITALVQDRPLVLVMGVFTLFAGLAMVLAHNLWRGGAVTVIVTVIGWIALLKALLILSLTPEVESRFLVGLMQSGRVFYFREVVTFVLGAYLTYGGFAASSRH